MMAGVQRDSGTEWASHQALSCSRCNQQRRSGTDEALPEVRRIWLGLSRAGSVTKPQGTYAVAGVQPKVVAEQKYELACSICDLRVAGHLENTEFDEATQSFTVATSSPTSR
jgi:hypothetical protein